MKIVKILIAIIGLFVCSAEGTQGQATQKAQTVFDLPDDTPGLVFSNNPTHQLKKKTPVDFGVINSYQIVNRKSPKIVLRKGSITNHEGIEVRIKSHSLFFPINAHQPTTEDAVRWSCATIDNEKNSPITKWYMQMFGVMPFRNEENPQEDDYIKAGYDKSGTPCKIIDITGLSQTDTKNELPKKYANQQDAFVQNFQKIASTSVGRTLLYRILIEIRRKEKQGGKKERGATEDYMGKEYQRPTDVSLITRNQCRAIHVVWDHDGGYFNPSNCEIAFGVQYPEKKISTIGPKSNNYYNIFINPRPNDVGLFHEMLHWYHFLRNPLRFAFELESWCLINGYDDLEEKYSIEIGKLYWGPILDGKGEGFEHKISSVPWLVKHGDKYQIAFEEIRTILGSAKVRCPNEYIEGDDISENLYRLNIDVYLRYGHTTMSFWEDRRIIDNVINVCHDNFQKYETKAVKIINDESYNSLKDRNKPDPKYMNSPGLGNCKIYLFKVELVEVGD